MLINQTRGRSRTAATFKMELFVIIVNGFQPLTIITKCHILDVAVVLDPPLQTLKRLQQRVICNNKCYSFRFTLFSIAIFFIKSNFAHFLLD